MRERCRSHRIFQVRPSSRSFPEAPGPRRYLIEWRALIFLAGPWMPTRSQRLHELDDAVPAQERWQPITWGANWRDHHLLFLAFARLLVRQAEGCVHLAKFRVA